MLTKSSGLINADLNLVELQVVNMIRTHINHILYGRAKQRKIGIDWIYNGLTKVGDFNLEECCRVIDIPQDLIRIRMQFELFHHSITWTSLTSELPIVIREEIEFYYSADVYKTALKIWQNPGICTNILHVDDEVISLMQQNNLAMINNFNQCWLTCRNPITSKNIHWTKCWSFYEK